jgi:AAA family ATP:ADP antiporter
MVLIKSALARLVDIRPGEHRLLLTAFAYFFTLLGSYYLVRSIRDAMGLAAGSENIQYLYLATIAAMLALVPLFGWVTSRWPRKRFIPYSYYVCAGMQLLFAALFMRFGEEVNIARAFYIWVNVYNLFVVSVFWSFMTDLFNREQAARLFGFIAAGGSCGAALGPLLTSTLVQSLGVAAILGLSALFLMLSVLCVHALNNMTLGKPAESAAVAEDADTALGGGAWDGIKLALGSRYLAGIAVIMLCYSLFSTFMYFQQVEIIGQLFTDTAERSVMFARVDLLVNVLTIICQLFFTGRIIKHLGISWTLALIPLLLSVGLVLLALAPAMGWSLLIVILGLQVVRRVGSYALINPAREALFVLLSREEKYKAKNFIDTSVIRAGDVISVGMLSLLKMLGLALGGMALLTLLITVPWLLVSVWLGREHQRLSSTSASH